MPNDIRITELPLLNRDLVDTDEFAIDDLNGNTNKVTLRGLKMAAGGESYTKTQIDELLALKENKLTFDSTPTDGSTNPVTSNGVYDALDALSDRITDSNIDELLLCDFIKNTRQEVVYATGTTNITGVRHVNTSNVVVRTDTYSVATNPLVETRTLNTGESLTISTNLTTLVTTITYTPASA